MARNRCDGEAVAHVCRRLLAAEDFQKEGIHRRVAVNHHGTPAEQLAVPACRMPPMRAHLPVMRTVVSFGLSSDQHSSGRP
eukprot:55825-Eustigmatos_ZCMA.PRE.1